jgi:hypothetical protein
MLTYLDQFVVSNQLLVGDGVDAREPLFSGVGDRQFDFRRRRAASLVQLWAAILAEPLCLVCATAGGAGQARTGPTLA